MIEVKAQFPKLLLPEIFRYHRNKVFRGGRGSAKSWSVARALLIMASRGKLEVLCAREFQSSIRDSVHKLLSNQIELLGLGGLFDIQKDAIYGPHGSKFVFVGLSDKTAENLKSYEGFDVCWVEEAQVTSERSWRILLPTIRKDGSEIWVTFNPELDTDPTWVEFIEHPPPDTFSVEMNWRDNPWFNDTLEQQRKHAQETLSKADYENIWEGKCRPAVSGAIYAEEVAMLHVEHRIGDYPVDPFHLVYPIFDLGWNDKMAIILAQRNISQMRLVDYIEVDHKTLDWCSQELRKRNVSWGKIYLPHDGASKDYKTGRSAQEILEDLKWTVEVLPNASINEGLRAARMMFSQVYMDRIKCARLLECLKRYRRSIPNSTGEPGAPLHDEWSHGADAYRYLAMAAPGMDDEIGLTLPPLKYGKSGH